MQPAIAAHTLRLMLISGAVLCLFSDFDQAQSLDSPGAISPNTAQATSKPSKHKAAASEPSPTPAIAIPVAPLRFAAPAAYYLGDRIAQLSLNFLSEQTLLFTFRVPGLIARDSAPSASLGVEDFSADPRTIRALVLELPSGRVTAEALWKLHDYRPYLWALKDGKFFLRDKNLIQMGDSTLRLTPFLRFPGLVNSLDLDPEERLLVANTTEAPAAAKDQTPESKPTGMQSPAAGGGPDRSLPAMQHLVRILRMEDRGVMLFTRALGNVHIPVDGDGYYEALRGSGNFWVIVFNRFGGASTQLLRLESECNPTLDVQSAGIVLISACNASGGRQLQAIARKPASDKPNECDRLWESATAPTSVWPRVDHAASGLRLARSTLEVTHPVTASSPIGASEIRSQVVEVYDLATGKVELRLKLSPILDAGGNFALSPSGNRLAVLNAGEIQVYELPPAPSLPMAGESTAQKR